MAYVGLAVYICQATPSGFWGLVWVVFQKHGVVALLLIAVCFIFYKLIWKVWNAAMQAKNEEIARLVAERDKYQRLVFDRLLSSDVQTSVDDQEPDQEETQ